jgi:hypothetical protein
VRAPDLPVRLLVASICVALAGLAVKAQRGGGAAASGPPVPVTASSLAAHPLEYVGRTVAMMGTVARQLSPTVFTVEQGHATTLPIGVLVIAPALTEAPASGAYVSVVGAAVTFDPADLGALKGYALDIPPDVAAQYRGHPAVLATAVVGPDLWDLTKRRPTPMTPEEQAFSELMKQVNPAVTALRTGVTASDAAAARQRALELKRLFADVQAFFRKRGVADAEGWAGEAVRLSESIDAASAASNWPQATEATTSLNRLCSTCHAAHRERQEDGSYRIKGA